MKRLMNDGGLIILFLIFMVGVARADSTRQEQAEQTAASSILTGPIHFYQEYLSGADGHRCPMTPSCSGYAVQAIRRHGAFLGWIMTCDRLMRCGRDELKLSPSVITRQGIRCQDPLDNNDFWLR
ncbi:membrane protein insertion efficiency factor YidD [Desulfosarcina widdelii]|nr:membrane protein insertion efficiency factor YidD [Desulfosarcina widdelii]